MPKIRTFFVFFLCGAGFFWLPDTLMHVFFGEMNQIQLIIMTIVMIISTAIGHVFLEQTFRKDHLLVPPALLTGIWLTAGLAMGVNGLFTGAGFAVPNGWTIIFTGMIPPLAFLMSSYDGSFLALSVVTVGLLARWIWRLFHI